MSRLKASLSKLQCDFVILAVGKNIVLLCDGTGQDTLATSFSMKGAAKVMLQKRERSRPYPTNVLRLSRCITQYTEEEPRRQQLVYYQSGVSAGDDFQAEALIGSELVKLRGTAIGSKIRDAYNFIAQNWAPGDKIYLFGFSRGAYTVRKVAGLIGKLGILSRLEMDRFFLYWNALYKNDTDIRIERGMDAPVEFLGTWDTVGSIHEHIFSPKKDALSLRDTELPDCVETARHALAYHDNLKMFMPTYYTGYDSTRDVEEVWFPGVHSDVGGGYEDHFIADISLCWMAGEAVISGLGLDEAFLLGRLKELDETSPPELLLHSPSSLLPRANRMKRLPSSQFLYHASLWAEVRESPDGPSLKAAIIKAVDAPSVKPLTEFERLFWRRCGWDRLIPQAQTASIPQSDRQPLKPGPSLDPVPVSFRYLYY
ncbi:hypothetical protein FRC07_001089 [Ceratobasidium sp. 392]|nr:hypothetical protein FRC07_001089 [Ceratobasidium sp. 392]